ncbi:pentatricopeptide repeat-containing protein, partial [Trifolium medium]|nr:pentatricopeptide repeat-containing protein [Trifolium medium]
MRLSKFGKCGTLLSVWMDMQECGYRSDVEVYEYTISGLYIVGQLENAVHVMEEALRKWFCPSRLVCSKLRMFFDRERTLVQAKLRQKSMLAQPCITASSPETL